MRKLLAALLYLVVSLLLVLAFNGVDIGITKEIPTQDIPIVQDIPNQHIIFYARTPFGIIAIPIPKGSLNANKEGIHWDTPKKYIEREKMKQKFRDEEQKFHEEYKKKRPEAFGKKQPV